MRIYVNLLDVGVNLVYSWHFSISPGEKMQEEDVPRCFGNRRQAMAARADIERQLAENRKETPYHIYDVEDFDAWVVDPKSICETSADFFDNVAFHYRAFIERAGLIRMLQAIDRYIERIDARHGRRASTVSPQRDQRVH